MTWTSDRISDARLAEMLEGLEGVTPGPWKAVCQPNFSNGYTYTSVQPAEPDPATMQHLAMAGGEYHICRMTHTPMERKYRRYEHDARHISRCDPDTMRSILTELQSLRAAALEPLGVSGEPVALELHHAIDEYWRIAWREGAAGRVHDTAEGDAERVRVQIDGLIIPLYASPPKAEITEELVCRIAHDLCMDKDLKITLAQMDPLVKALTAALSTKEPGNE